MSHYGITAIRWNTAHTEVEACRLHKVTQDSEGNFILDDGASRPFDEVASLIASDDKVWVMVRTLEGAFDKREPVIIRGQRENLYSSPENNLFDLPEL
jgi:hypothetical protein